MTFDLQQIVEATSGQLVPAGSRGRLTGVSTDSRSIKAGELFVPLRGERFDGHDYLGQALRAGAGACLSEEVVDGFPVPVVRVPDTLRALGDLARFCRRRWSGPLVGVTGSSGKTTTKEMLAAILHQTGPGLKTEGNFNNLIGLPLTLLRLIPEHRWAVIEMGMSARGEIEQLAGIALPQVGVVTNVGPAHLETLQGLDGVARAKGELFAALPAAGCAVVNADDPRVLGMPVANGARRILYGLAPEAEVRAEGVKLSASAGVEFSLVLPAGAWPVRLPVPGRHNVHNALAAAAAAYALEVPGEVISHGLGAFAPTQGRMHWVELQNGIRLLDDSYNANPLSVKAALATLDELGATDGRSGRRIAVLGDMLELGLQAERLHHEVGQAAAASSDLLVAIGALAAKIADGAREAGMASDQVVVAASHEEIASMLRDALNPGDRVLVKGSRGARMERVCSALKEMVLPGVMP